MIREYIAAVEEKAKGSGELTDELKNWIQWAQMKTDWYDPFLDHPDPDLEGVDKDIDIQKNQPVVLKRL